MFNSAVIVIEEFMGKQVLRYANGLFLETFEDHIGVDPDD